jgi:hypothetical protein
MATEAIDLSDRDTVRALRVAVNEALEDLGEVNGVEFKWNGRISMDRDGAYCAGKLTCSRVGETGFTETPEVVAFKEKAHLYGLHPGLLHRLYKTPEGIAMITGLNTNARSYPVQYSKNNKKYKASPTHINNLIDSGQWKEA